MAGHYGYTHETRCCQGQQGCQDAPDDIQRFPHANLQKCLKCSVKTTSAQQ